jgi:hypothetical protein
MMEWNIMIKIVNKRHLGINKCIYAYTGRRRPSIEVVTSDYRYLLERAGNFADYSFQH